MIREVPCVFLIITFTVLSNNSRAFSSFLASGCTGFCTPMGFMFVILKSAAGTQGQCSYSCAASQQQVPHADKHWLRKPCSGHYRACSLPREDPWEPEVVWAICLV